MILKILKKLKAILALVIPMLTPITPQGIESIVEPIRALYDPSGDGLGIRRSIAESIMHHKRGLLTCKLLYLLDSRKSIAVGNAWLVLDGVKKEEKARELKRQEEIAATDAKVV